ncbi:MAG: hypothetical protein AB7I30_20860 [Isosphaeraceae bacterium]
MSVQCGAGKVFLNQGLEPVSVSFVVLVHRLGTLLHDPIGVLKRPSGAGDYQITGITEKRRVNLGYHDLNAVYFEGQVGNKINDPELRPPSGEISASIGNDENSTGTVAPEPVVITLDPSDEVVE